MASKEPRTVRMARIDGECGRRCAANEQAAIEAASRCCPRPALRARPAMATFRGEKE